MQQRDRIPTSVGMTFIVGRPIAEIRRQTRLKDYAKVSLLRKIDVYAGKAERSPQPIFISAPR
jgi:hypothetical protein